MSNKISKTLDAADEGPAMAALTPLQRGFVKALVIFGGNETDAARAAGYGGDHPQSVRNAAWKLAHDPRVKLAIREYADARISAAVPLAAEAMVNILLNPAHKDHFRAIERTLNQAGMQITTKHEVEVTDNRTADELKAYITTIANAHGLDVRKILGHSTPALPAPDIIDVIGTDVSDKEEVIAREEWEDDNA